MPTFTDDELEALLEDGLVVVPDALSPTEVDHWRAVVDDFVRSQPPLPRDVTRKYTNVVEHDERFEPLIDHPAHLGFVHDLYGAQLRLAQSEVVIRSAGEKVNSWHVDGPRAVPFQVYSPTIPLKLKVAYWLTDLVGTDAGNFVYVPGSQRPQFSATLTGSGDVPGQRVLQCRAGTMTLMHAGVWHRVNPNRTSVRRTTIFLSYGPSWVTAYQLADPSWAAGLEPTRRVIMRPYVDQEELIRPPADDLEVLGSIGRHAADLADDGAVEPEAHKRRRQTAVERYLDRRAARPGEPA